MILSLGSIPQMHLEIPSSPFRDEQTDTTQTLALEQNSMEHRNRIGTGTTARAERAIY